MQAEKRAGTNTIVALKAVVSVSQEGLASLCLGTWLSDEIINFECQVMISRSTICDDVLL